MTATFSAVTSFDYPKSDDDWAFIEQKGHEGFEAGRYSVAFSTPPPGCTYSPTFVRNPVEQKRRWIIDHSGSGLNNGIAAELTHPRYDLLSDLIRLLRQLLSTAKGDRPRQIQLWRADVKDAFLGVPMRAEWQMHQLLRFRDSDGREYFRVDQCMEFGNRASPYLWSIVEGFLLHLAQAGGFVPTPLAFVDDAFGADASGRTAIVNVGKKLVRHPPQLAGMIEVFKSVGAPFVADKQLAGSRLRVLGIEVDAEEGSIAVPDDQKRRFALLSDELLAPKPHGIAIYRTWLGRAQFVGVATPWAKWRLNLLYKAVALWERDKGRHPTAKRRLKVEERCTVEAYLDEVLSSAPLSIFDATLQRWPMSACDVVIWSDSCGCASNARGGLGFVLHDNRGSDGSDLGFYHRGDKPYSDNNLAEAIACFSAFETALQVHPRARRICLFTDSSATIYALDAGKGNERMLELAARMFRLSQERKVDYRVRHVPGERNTRADTLSRAPLAQLRQEWGDRLSYFSPSMLVTGGLTP